MARTQADCQAIWSPLTASGWDSVSSPDREASQFVAEVTSDEGGRILSDNGFYQPASGPTG